MQGEQQQCEAVQKLQGGEQHQDQLRRRSTLRGYPPRGQGIRFCVLLRLGLWQGEW